MSLKQLPEIQIDWNDDYGQMRIGLNCNIAQMYIREQGITLTKGLRVHLTGDDLESEAIIEEFEGSGGHKIWVAKVVDGTLKTVQRDPLKPFGF
jgi:hypothetical protein